MAERYVELKFKTAQGTESKMTIPDARADVTDGEINSAMDNILSSGIFTTAKGDLVAKASAAVVDKTTTDVVLS